MSTQTSTHSTAPTRAAARRMRRLGSTAALVAAVAAPVLPTMSATPAVAAEPVPRVPVTLPAGIEPLAAYDPASTCHPSPYAGTVALKDLLLKTYRDSRSLGMSRDCSIGGPSEHKEGRAFDWGNRAWVPGEAANVKAFTSWLFAADKKGNQYAMARRLGIMYLVWNDHIWSAARSSEGWRPYTHPQCKGIKLSSCSSTLRHRDHLHISLSRAGALKKTSFWTGKVYGSPAPAPKPASSPKPARLNISRGTVLRKGSHNAAVVKLQRALRMPTVSTTFGPQTEAAVKRFQGYHRISRTGMAADKTLATLQDVLDWHAARIVKVDHLVLKPGAKGSAVKVAEAALRRPSDGRLGSHDVAAIKIFQRLHGIKADGTIGSKTWFALRGV